MNVHEQKNVWDWEAHMDVLLAPPVEQQHESNREEVTTSLYKGWDYGRHTPIETKVTLVKMDRQEFPTKTVFPARFPEPLVCREFCGKSSKCRLIENGFGDLCKHHHLHGKLVKPVNKKWKAKNEKRSRATAPRPEFVKATSVLYSSNLMPEDARCNWGDPETQKPREDEVNETAARDAYGTAEIGFMPAFIYGPGQPTEAVITDLSAPGNQRLVRHESLRAIGCKVALDHERRMVIALGRPSVSYRMKTRADRMREDEIEAMRRFVGKERAEERVAIAATC